MKINSEIVDAYINEGDVECFRNHWIYNTIGQGEYKGTNIFISPNNNKDNRTFVAELSGKIKNIVKDFSPWNLEIWTELFPDWNNILRNIEIYLIVGLPEPNDATVAVNPEGKNVIILDLLCWKNYENMNVSDLICNLLTHECCHVCIASKYNKIEYDYDNGDYQTCFDSLVFNEGFAHLVSYCADISKVNWNAQKFFYIKENALSLLKEAYECLDSNQQKKYLYNAVFENYFDKFGCMAGMFYFLDVYLNNGTKGLKRAYESGYNGIVERIISSRNAI